MENELPVSGDSASAATSSDLALNDAIQTAQERKPIDVEFEHVKEGDEPKEGEEKLEEKPAKTAEQREIDRLRKSTARLTRQREEARAQLALTRANNPITNQDDSSDSETLSLTRAQLDEMVKQQAEKLAPTLQTQRAEIEHRKSIVDGLAKSWGQEKFDELASDLDEAFGGLADENNRPKPATDALFESDDPKALIEYLADPDNVEEAEQIAAMSAIKAGRAIAKLEAKLEAAKKDAKPKPSNAPKPLEAVKGAGISNGPPDPIKDPKGYRDWANKQERLDRGGR